FLLHHRLSEGRQFHVAAWPTLNSEISAIPVWRPPAIFLNFRHCISLKAHFFQTDMTPIIVPANPINSGIHDFHRSSRSFLSRRMADRSSTMAASFRWYWAERLARAQAASSVSVLNGGLGSK